METLQESLRVSVVIPVFNEIADIRDLYKMVAGVCIRENYDYEIICIDDGSDDGTRESLKQISMEDSRFRYIFLKRNFGQTAAMSAGFDHARGDFVVTMDGDLQNDPEDIPKMLAKCLEGYDCVAGWRRKRKDPFFSKSFPSRIANWVIRRTTKVKIHDSGCTLKVLRREALSDLRLYGEMHRFIPALLHWSGASIAEVEVNHRARIHGKSKYRFSKIWRVILDLVTIRFLLNYSTRPIHMFGKLGLYCFTGCAVSFLALIAMKLFWNIDMTGNPFMLLTVVLSVVGVQFISMGFLGEISMRTYHESTSRKIYRIAEMSGIQDRNEMSFSSDISSR